MAFTPISKAAAVKTVNTFFMTSFSFSIVFFVLCRIRQPPSITLPALDRQFRVELLLD
jgi:hypothetical protein